MLKMPNAKQTFSLFPAVNNFALFMESLRVRANYGRYGRYYQETSLVRRSLRSFWVPEAVVQQSRKTCMMKEIIQSQSVDDQVQWHFPAPVAILILFSGAVSLDCIHRLGSGALLRGGLVSVSARILNIQWNALRTQKAHIVVTDNGRWINNGHPIV
jgi:hypothetical protein